MPLVEDDDVVEEFPTKAANHPLHIGILPRRARGRDDLIDAQAFNPSRNPLTDNAIAVSNQITWSRIERKRLNELLCCPLGRRVFRGVEVDNSPSIMGQDDEHEEHPKCRGRYEKEIDSNEILDMLIEKGPPAGRRRFVSTGSVLLHR